MSNPNWKTLIGTMTVYRVEDAAQGGPYNGAHKNLVRECLPHLFGSVDEVENRHPVPYADIAGWRYQDGYHFGFASIAQLNNWFNQSERETLERLGFKIARYTIADEHVLHGLHQVAFDRSKATRAPRRQSLAERG